MDSNDIAKSIHINGADGQGMWPMMAAMCNNGGGFGGNNSWLGMLLLVALLDRKNFLNGGCPDGTAFAAGGVGRDILCSIQSQLGDLSGKLLASQIALSDNIAQSTNSLTQNANANFANTNNQIRDMNGELVSGFAAAAMERCAMTSKLATDINQVGAAVLSSTNQLDKTVMCGFNGLNTNLSNTAQSIKDQANAQFNVLSTKSDGIACGIEKLSVQTACQTKDIINNDNNNTQQILCSNQQTRNEIIQSEQRLSKQISDANYQQKIAELEEKLACQHRNESIVFQNNMNRNFQIMSDSIGALTSRLQNFPIALAK